MKSKTAIKVMLWLISAIIIFHICILVHVIPYEFTWGGRLKNKEEMFVFESISILINLLLIAALLIKGSYIKPILPIKVVHIILWIFFGIFCLNTLGNMVAKTNFEKSFTILTLTFAYLLWIILRKDNK
ncbi:hypothetical protein DNU06_08085 [Putridiphycobacter roseus]|uniref:Uncharacterized protein n=1 Tax=Putridiphycobacter roseus TaxID=2219161 RepID=A0A2W1NDN7_9FLAO|nr:hypothetical protein [Putridiphycobacter roseus]PZE17223.1 hypothetical protein DNU06_08085 [Putridiphycobacter roseus]